MGFKKTSEGRVFFRGVDEDSPAMKKTVEYRGVPPQNNAGQATQLQILALLRSLNEKLKDSQSERAQLREQLESYRRQIEDLESKAEKNERNAQEFEQKLAKADKGSAGKAERAEKMAEDTLKELTETRRLISELEEKTHKADKGVLVLQTQLGQTRSLNEELVKKQIAVQEDMERRLNETENRQDDLTQKIEDAASQHAKLSRQVEKAIEDRARFMRKIERIEETVIQTRDALTAKAMVLLTEQGMRAADAVPVKDVTPKDGAKEGARDRAQFWDSAYLQAAAVVFVLLTGLAAGWLAGGVQDVNLQIPSLKTSSAEQQTPPPPAADIDEQPAAPEATADITASEAAPAQDIEPVENTGQFAEQQPKLTNPPPAPDLEKVDDIGTLDVKDEQKLLKMLDENPDALAKQLNDIEPSKGIDAGKMEKPAKAEKTAIIEQKAAEEPAAPVVEKAAAPAAENPRLSAQISAAMAQPDLNLPEAAREVERQALEGVPEAQHDLAAIYIAGRAGVKQDYKRARFWFEQAAEQGVSNARYNLGVLYHQGLGVKPDLDKAIEWYKSAAELGHPEAQYNLGIAYIEGIGVSYDPVKAATYFENAARQGIMEAAYNLGLIYENGLLGDTKPDKALMWYKTAADQGSPEAKEALEQLAKTLNIKVEDVNRLAESMKPEVKSGNN
ncbi:MAG: SEL1-like repeat protein [Alphaproteobacteria bacterium]|nr:SEL1-like repeat protein [Alphaproteobacteria bacterium]